MGEYFLEFRLMARRKFANRTTLLHGVVHFFLDFRFRIARELQGSFELTESCQAFLRRTERVLEWFDVKSLDE